MAAKKVTEPFKLGDLVRIGYVEFPRGRIVELRGALDSLLDESSGL